MANTIILYSHPYEGSLSAGIKNEIVKAVNKKGDKAIEVNLFKDKFDPVKASPALIKKYKKDFKEAETIIIASPVWWSGVPAIMQGYFEQVISEGDIYTIDKAGNFIPKDIKLKKALIFTTAETPNIFARLVLAFPIKYRLISMFKQLKVKSVKFSNLDCASLSQERRERFIKKVTDVVGGKNE